MRRVLVLLPIALLLGCSFADSVQEAVASQVFGAGRECIGMWPLGSRLYLPDLLSPTLEERTAGEVDVVLARLGSTSSALPEPDEKTESVLGFVTLDFHVLEYLKPKSPEFLGTVQSTVHVGYECIYAESNRRDREALVRVENKLQEFFGDRLLILFSQDGKGFLAYGEVSFGKGDGQSTSFGDYHSGWPRWNDGEQFLLQAVIIGDNNNPYFIDPLRSKAGPVNHTIDLREIRDRVNAVIAEEVDRGVECVGALYRHQWYTRSGEEEWYRGELGPDNVPVECAQ